MHTTINVDIRALANLLDTYSGMADDLGFNPDDHETYRLLDRQIKRRRDGYMTDPTAPLVMVDQWRDNAKTKTVKLIRAATGSSLCWAYDEACALETVGRRLPRATRQAIEAVGVTFKLASDDIS